MKASKLFIAVVLSVASVAASAATYVQNFTSSTGQVFNINDARVIEELSYGAVALTFRDAGYTGGYLTDTSGAVMAKIVASDGFSKHWVKLQGVQKYINVDAARYVYCNAGTGVMTLAWAWGTPTEVSDPGCVVYNQIKSLGN